MCAKLYPKTILKCADHDFKAYIKEIERCYLNLTCTSLYSPTMKSLLHRNAVII